MNRYDEQKRKTEFGRLAAMALVAVMLTAPGRSLAVTRTWDGGGANANASTKENWSDDTAPVTNDAIVLDAGTSKNMTWDLDIPVASWTQVGYAGTVTLTTLYGATGFTNLVITGDCVISNGVWTQTANPAALNYETNRLRVSIGGNLTLGPSAAIDVTGKGYGPAKGPGYNGLLTPSYAPGSYGGSGSRGGGPCYGSVTAPVNLGSGGGSGSAGGGAIFLTVVGTIRHDGRITANGNPTGNINAGSGGSIYLIAGDMLGEGEIRANGGADNNFGSGGGGRVALIVTNAGADYASFTGPVSTFGSDDLYYASRSAAGTIYLEQASDSPNQGQLVVDNAGGYSGFTARTDLNGIEAVTYNFRRITLTNNANLGVGPDVVLIATNTVLNVAPGQGSGIWLSGGTLQTAAAFTYSNLFIGIASPSATFSPATSLTIGTNAEFRVDQPHVMTGVVIVAAGGTITHTANNDTEIYKMDLTVDGSLTVQPGGSIDVTAKGYAKMEGLSGGNYGASHGGRGSGGYTCYGSITSPTNSGSGGQYGAGGGAVRLTVTGTVTNRGVICADGAPVAAHGRTGAGGSIWLTADTLDGTGGQIRASGGTNSTMEGAGGRISLTLTNMVSFEGPMPLALGPKSAGAGTVYIRTMGQGPNEGSLFIDNQGVAGYTDIQSNVTDTVVGDVLIRNKAHLFIATDQSLTVGGIWSNAANFTAQWESRVEFAGASGSTSTVYGATTFMGLVCTNELGKTIRFEAGQTNTVAALGRLTLAGVETSTNVLLRSTLDGTPWKLKVNPLAEQSVVFVDVKDSDALTGVGAEVTAMNSGDSGNNPNWRFITVGVGQTNAWTGNSNTLWTVRQNWSLDRSPIESDFILIPSSKPRYPELGAARTVNGLEIQSGASLSLAGYNLTVTTNAIVAGTLIASGTETVTFQGNTALSGALTTAGEGTFTFQGDADISGALTAAGTETFVFQGDVDFTGGSLAPAASTMMLAGNGPQQFDPANLSFHRIAVLNDAGTVAFLNGFSAAELRCEAANGTRNLQFQQGATVDLESLSLLGSDSTTNIQLRSSADGQSWNLAVKGHRFVRGVDVRDSHAGGGLPIPALATRDSGNNVNWQFDAVSAVWQGTASANFHTTANWLPAAIPGPASRVLVETTNPMTITGAVTVLDLIVGGGAGVASVTANASVAVVETITVLSNGLLVLNRPCVVSNDVVVMAGGTLTHSLNYTTEANKLDLTIFGSVNVDANGAIDVTGQGYASAKGPGGGNYSASHGGRGSGNYTCYGSILAPTNLGSGGQYTRGGGAIRMTVSGTLRNQGFVGANGTPGNRTGAGGSLFLTLGKLTGVGMIEANGGTGTEGGAGGRIALIVTNTGADFASFQGAIQAVAGTSGAGGGTIYRQTATDRPDRGLVTVDNGNNTGNTDVPPFLGVPDEAVRAIFRVTNTATLRLTNDFTVGDIWLDTANAWLDLGGHTLTVNTREHPLGLVENVRNPGTIIWTGLPPGVLIIVK